MTSLLENFTVLRVIPGPFDFEIIPKPCQLAIALYKFTDVVLGTVDVVLGTVDVVLQVVMGK